MSDKLNIEELMQTRLDGAELLPSPQSWKAIQQKLRWPQFLRFNPGRFNIYYAGVLLVATASVVWLLSAERDRTVPTVPEDNINAIAGKESALTEVTSKPVDESRGSANASGSEGQNSTSTSSSQTGKKPVSGEETSGSNSGEAAESNEASQKNAEMIALIPLLSATDPQPEQLPVTYFTSSIQSGCVPLTVQFTNQSVYATTFYWDFGTGDTSREQNPVYEFKEAGRFMVTLTAENQGGLPTVSRMMVEVLAAPVADFQIDEGMDGVDNHVVLNLVNYSSDGSVFVWNLVDEACVNCSGWSSLEYQPSLGLKSISPDSRSVKLEVISENGCSDTAMHQLPLVVETSETRIKFANAFSPNPSGPGDGTFHPGSKRIDLFHPLYIEVPVEFRMRIYTRRGELIFETREIYQGWDGYLQQEAAPADVYVWMAEGRWADGESFSYKGDVTVVWNQYW